ncbi:ABC-F family ATP-binding cassette domain-containing protein [Streptobacillus moniliformis]|uniref:ABC-F family ATP-binding cassette domain-containing protein n=1 Tax=Streptobacillus moniliformis TaxID=34105 RepID=UPI0007E4BBE3|nr:ABC-F family ATP-binding cassette domain-containing protein [Streptobacillus moniliformis]QXW65293.1 ABC-F family ATP-binding cassette domain-containing protein [Streptobacillus moniliformis]
MNLVQFNNVWKQYNGEYILKDISFSVDHMDKIGLIGLNGVGKSSLIKILLGKENHDGKEGNVNEKGNVFLNPNIKVGYLSQNHSFASEKNTVYEELLEVFYRQKELLFKINILNTLMSVSDNIEELLKDYEKLQHEYEATGGYEIEFKIKQVMQGLELNNFRDINISSLSGGEKTRVTLAKLLLQEPDLLILDEPTNHLDIVSIEWLEEYLKKYTKAFILISHDRIFLDEVCNKIMEIENRKIYEYSGNFSDFVIQKELYIKGEIKRFEKESEKIRKIEEYISRYKAGIKAKQARGRQTILDRMERMDNPVFNINRMKLKFEMKSQSADRVLSVNKICKSFDNKKVLNNVSFDLYKGDKVGIIGKNGIGKSTLLKILIGNLKQDSGDFKIGERVHVGYYDQDHQNLYPSNNILQEINNSLSYTEEYLRSKAAAFLFTSDDVLKQISLLSGGEKVRVSLLKLIEEKANLLILDEPTNHLDIYSIEVLENALIDYMGTMLLISHNRHFLDSVCNKIYFLSENGLEEFKGNYGEYKESIKNKKEVVDKTEEKLSYEERKSKQKAEIKRKKDLEKLEKNIEEISKKLKSLDDEMAKAGKVNDLEKMISIQKEIDDMKIREDELILLWSELE